MEYLFDSWGTIEGTIKSANHVFLFMDFDGTLTTIVSKPELATLNPRTKALIKRIARSHFFTVAILSGRSLEEIKKQIGIGGIYYGGNHGLEVEGPHLRFLSSQAQKSRPVIQNLAAELRNKLHHIQGVIVENKGLTLSLHYRLVDKKETDEVKQVFDKVAIPLIKKSEIKATFGKKVFEIRPLLDWDKGKAVCWMIKSLFSYRRILPIYIGDDQTDEDAFEALRQFEGISIFVGSRGSTTKAKYFLESPKDTQKFLELLHKSRMK